MKQYAIHVNLTGCTTLVVGAGAVGLRKIQGLIAACPQKIIILDPALKHNNVRDPLEKIFAEFPHIKPIFLARSPQESDFHGVRLAFAATDNSEINRQVYTFCQRHNVLCNMADAQYNDFTVPAHSSTEGIDITLSTGGASPALARQLRLDIEELIKKRYTGLSGVLKRLRPLILSLQLTTAENTVIFRSIVVSSLGELLSQGNVPAARQLLQELLPEALHTHIEKVLYDF